MFEEEKKLISHNTLELGRWMGNFLEMVDRNITILRKQVETLTAENKALRDKYEPKPEQK